MSPVQNHYASENPQQSLKYDQIRFQKFIFTAAKVFVVRQGV